MAKPKKIIVDGYNFYFWPYEEQTRMKHKVLVEYFDIWATKLGKYHSISFFDCHGGCGAYWIDGSPFWGSSLLIAEKGEILYKRLNRDIRTLKIYVTESDQDNCENLAKVMNFRDDLMCKSRISKITFEDMIKNEECRRIYSQTPSLFFIDPFGYCLDYSVLVQIMRYPKNELLINFMFDYINRFISLPDQAANFNALFGCEDWKEAILLSGFEREKKLVEVFKKQLKRIAKHVFAYKLSFYDKERTYYYIFHATDNLDGCAIMKSCFASLNNGKVEYLGNRNDTVTLFDLYDFKTQEVKDYLLSRFEGTKISFTEIVEAIIDDTFFLEKDIRSALKCLLSEGHIQKILVSSKTDRGLSGDDIINFSEVKK